MIESEEAVDDITRSIAVNEQRAKGTNKLPQVNAIAFACTRRRVRWLSMLSGNMACNRPVARLNCTRLHC
jgi:hypothetical protein